MSAVIKQNPSFIGSDGDQIDVTFYPSRSHGQMRDKKPIVEVRQDNAIRNIQIAPRDIPDLIEALQQVHRQYMEYANPDCVVSE